jgi:hypothetical protein
MHRLPDPERARTLGADDLRAAFLVRGLFTAGRVTLRHRSPDRVIVVGVPPGRNASAGPPAWLAPSISAPRDGRLNIGDGITVPAGTSRATARRSPPGRGTRDVSFSRRARSGWRDLLVSYPAHASHPGVRSAGRWMRRPGGRWRQPAAGHTSTPAAQTAALMGDHARDRYVEYHAEPPPRPPRVHLYSMPENDVRIHLLGEPGERASRRAKREAGRRRGRSAQDAAPRHTRSAGPWVGRIRISRTCKRST